MPIRDVDIRLRLLNARGFMRDMRGASAEIRAVGLTGIASAKGLVQTGSALRKIGGTMTTHVTLPIAAGAVALAKYSMDFHQQMTLIQTQTGASGREVQRMTGYVLQLSKQFGVAPTTIARALFHIESVGLRGPRAMDALRESVKGSVVGLADLESVSSTLAGTWLVKIAGSGRQFHDVMAELNATVGAGNIRMDDLVKAIGTGILPIAKEAHLGLRDVTGALALMTDEGTPANTAMRLLRTSLNFVVAPTTKATKGLRAIGLSQTAMAEDIRRPQGLLVALRDLHEHLDRLPGGARGIKAGLILRDLFPAGRGIPLHILLNQLGRYGMKMDQLRKIHQNYDRSVKRQLETPSQRWKIMMNQLRIAAINLGDAFTPIVMKMGGAASFLATKMSKLPPQQRKVLVDFATLLILIGPVTYLLGAMVGGLGRVFFALGGAYKAARLMASGLRAIWLWQRRVAAGELLTGWAKQGRNALGQFEPYTWKNRFAQRFTVLGRISGIAFRIAFYAAAIAIAYELYTKLVGPFNKFLEDKFGVLNASDPTNGRAQRDADQAAARRGRVRRPPGGGWIWHIRSAQEPWTGWVQRSQFHSRPSGPVRVRARQHARHAAAIPGFQPVSPTQEQHFHLYIDGKEVNNAVAKVEKRRRSRR